MLYPKDTPTREIKDLSGIWNFRPDWNNEGITQNWQQQPIDAAHTMPMPVPASYNDLTQSAELRDHIGWVWYETECWVPSSWEGSLLEIYVGAASHHAIVWINGQEMMRHQGGFLPFVCDATSALTPGQLNRITLAIDNTLTWQTLPPGELVKPTYGQYPEGYQEQEYHHDFFNYSGIHRPVKLIRKPRTRIEDLYIETDFTGTTGTVRYEVTPDDAFSQSESLQIHCTLKDATGRTVAEHTADADHSGTLTIPDVQLWSPDSPYLYHLHAEILAADASAGTVIDSYPLHIGVRTVELRGNEFLLNGQPFYFKGFGKHEDADIRGKGLDHVINIKDFNIMKWMGANSFRTSHYPYSEEIMDLADQYGFLVIDEVPAVGMSLYGTDLPAFCEERVNADTQKHHIDCIRELIARDKNHPCVVMWSVGNEPNSNEPAAGPYFKTVIEATRELNRPGLPITVVEAFGPVGNTVSQYTDIICLNRYYAWYENAGHLETITGRLSREFQDWYDTFGKPMLLTEYGADAIAGLHRYPEAMFTEEFQRSYLEACNAAIDQHDFVIGEQVWNFADFATKQGTKRVDGNKKGVLTRQREPKMSAHYLRERWLKQNEAPTEN